MLEIKNLVKDFRDLRALDNVSFTVENGQIMGLIGQNGAGKSTTFRLILNFINSNSGSILWNQQKITEEIYNDIGYLPEERGLYQKETIQDQLIFFAELRGKKKSEITPQIDYWLQKFQVKGKKTDKIKTLSKGNQQKIQLIATILHEPKLIILDEPFSGLDPVNAELFKEAIIELKQKGSAIIFSSHNMDNVEKLVDTLLMLKDGKVVLNGNLNSIRESFGRTKLFLESNLTENDLKEINGVKKVTMLNTQRFELTLENPEVGQIIFQKATSNGYIPVFDQEAPTLDEIFRIKVSEDHE